jgi:hypothetical protein
LKIGSIYVKGSASIGKEKNIMLNRNYYVSMFVAILIGSLQSFAQASDEIYFSFAYHSPDDLKKLSKIISIQKIDSKTRVAFAYARFRDFARMRQAPSFTEESLRSEASMETARELSAAYFWNVRELPRPSEGNFIVKMLSAPDVDSDLLSGYLTYQAYTTLLKKFAAQFLA